VIEEVHEAPAVPTPAPVAEPVEFAVVAGQPLVLSGATVGVGFHESGSPRALPMEPVGHPVANLNAPKIDLPPATPGPEYLVMPTRRRPHGATTAVDLRMDHGVPVTSPVDGVVETVAEYPLYGRFPDQFVEIVPHGRPDLLVRVLHVEAAAVAEGQEVRAAETVIAATTRQLPFGSQIDRYSGEGPHVHLEVHHRPEHMPVEPLG
jgi:murein DD-endopeptidase MepM/ murein hydrolase activator NlpD